MARAFNWSRWWTYNMHMIRIRLLSLAKEWAGSLCSIYIQWLYVYWHLYFCKVLPPPVCVFLSIHICKLQRVTPNYSTSLIVTVMINGDLFMCLYSQPFAEVVATVQVVKVSVYFQRHVHVALDGLDQTVKHVCKPFVIIRTFKAIKKFWSSYS